ncbi:MAG: hypothetical protein ACRD8U_15430 [Pyrinomonadaceae bacterium]
MAFLTLTKPLNRLLLSLSLLTFIWSPSGFAQTIESTAQLKQRAQALMEQLKYTEALPVLEKVIAAEPNDDVMRYLLASGVCDVFQQSSQRRHIAICIPAAIGIHEMLIRRSPEKFYRPPYVGVRGWVGSELDRVSDKELTLHINEAWRLIAPQKLQNEFDSEKRRSSE